MISKTILFQNAILHHAIVKCQWFNPLSNINCFLHQWRFFFVVGPQFRPWTRPLLVSTGWFHGPLITRETTTSDNKVFCWLLLHFFPLLFCTLFFMRSQKLLPLPPFCKPPPPCASTKGGALGCHVSQEGCLATEVGGGGGELAHGPILCPPPLSPQLNFFLSSCQLASGPTVPPPTSRPRPPCPAPGSFRAS